MLYTTQPLSSLPLHLSRGGDIPCIGYSNDASSGDVASEFTFEKNLGDDNKSKASQLVVIFSIWGKKPKDDNEPGGSSSSSTPKKITKKWQQASRLVAIYYTW
jgi:hypothetical protein